MATNRDIRNIYFWSLRWLTLWVTLLPVLQHRNIFLWSHIWEHLSLLRVFVEAECLRWCCCCLCPSKGSPRALARTTQSEVWRWETRVSHKKTGRPGHLGVLADHCGRFARSYLIALLHPIVAHSREAGRQNVAVILHTTLHLTKFIFTLCNKTMA